MVEEAVVLGVGCCVTRGGLPGLVMGVARDVVQDAAMASGVQENRAEWQAGSACSGVNRLNPTTSLCRTRDGSLARMAGRDVPFVALSKIW